MLQRLLSVLSVLVLVCLPNFTGSAMTYSNRINDSSWNLDSSVFECRMTHTMPFYGDAVFRRKAGESSSFFLAAKSSRLKTGQASLVFAPPVWNNDDKITDYGYVSVKQGLKPINLGTSYTERMLSELFEGMQVRFTRKPWYGADSSSNVEISSIGFRQVYMKYLDCLSGLLPVNYEQIQRTAVYFGTGKFELADRAEKTKLDNIVLYAKADSTVKKFYVDGHTDKFGLRGENFELSENRAKAVVDYLVAKGLPKDAIVVRWHGERYPADHNRHRKNRRVTVRLERDGSELTAMKK